MKGASLSSNSPEACSGQSPGVSCGTCPTQIPPWLLTEARLWEEPECLLGSMEEMPLRVSLLLLLGLYTLRLE